jgi:uncharacterized protein (DUF1778 family)
MSKPMHPAIQIRDSRPNNTMSFRAYDDHHALVHEAATRLGVSAANAMRKVVLEWAAGVLGRETPDLTMYDHTDLVGEAAKRLGMSTREYGVWAARETARTILASPDGTVPFMPAEGLGVAPRPATASGIPTQPRGKRKPNGRG